MIQVIGMIMCMGTAQYEIWGTPYDCAYVEKTSTAIESGLAYWDKSLLEIKNDFIGTYDQADTIALTELIWQRSLVYKRKLSVNNDLSLEKGDLVQLPDGRKFMIDKLSKTLTRGATPVLVLDCYKVMTA